ncbi:MAG: branched-chain amino acid ABC transporter permease [Crenarchaeota archaeon]|nr:branched-chain amino acid ABC transporter permease [Thermoproteota archaeon]
MVNIVSLLEYIGYWFGLYLLVSSGLNIEVGYAGIPDFGKAMSYAVGMLAVYPLWNWALAYVQGNAALSILLLIAIIVTSFVIGFAVGAVSILPAARLKEDYLAMYLLGIAEITVYLLYLRVFTPLGVTLSGDIFAWAGRYEDAVSVIIVIVVALAIFYLLYRLSNTPFGRVLKALRENELVVQTLGRNVMTYRIIAMGIGSGVAAIAGALNALYLQEAAIGVMARLYWTFIPWLIILLGGLGSLIGTLVGTLIYVIIRGLIRVYGPLIQLPFPPNYLFLWVMFGIVIIIILLFRPEGILPEKPILTKPMKRLRKQKEKERKESK